MTNEIKYYKPCASCNNSECVFHGKGKEYICEDYEPCEDVVSRQAVHDLLATWLSDYLTEETREALEVIDGKVTDLPSVQPKQRVGRWIGHKVYKQSREQKVESVVYTCSPTESIECDQCRSLFLGEILVRRNYCPNCGAKMEVEDGK